MSVCRQLISTVLQDGWIDRVWPGCFAGVLSPEESVDVPLQDGESLHCSRGGGGAGLWGGQLWKGAGLCCGRGRAADGLELVDDVTEDGVRTVPLYIKATVKLIQVVGQA